MRAAFGGSNKEKGGSRPPHKKTGRTLLRVRPVSVLICSVYHIS